MPGGSTIYASLWSSNESTPAYGIYRLTADGPQLMLADPKGSQVGYPMRSGWIADGKLCGYYVKESYSVVDEHYYIEVNADGETTRFDPLPDDCGYMFAATYNPDDRCIYGYGLTGGYSYALLKAPADNPGAISSVREFEWEADEECLSIAYNTSDQNLYGVNARGQFVKIDKSTGLQTNLANVPDGTQGIISGMCYAPKENLFYWNPLFSSGNSAIYTIPPRRRHFHKSARLRPQRAIQLHDMPRQGCHRRIARPPGNQGHKFRGGRHVRLLHNHTPLRHSRGAATVG